MNHKETGKMRRLGSISRLHWLRIVLLLAFLASVVSGCGWRTPSTGQNRASLEMLDGTPVPVE